MVAGWPIYNGFSQLPPAWTIGGPQGGSTWGMWNAKETWGGACFPTDDIDGSGTKLYPGTQIDRARFRVLVNNVSGTPADASATLRLETDCRLW